MRVLHIETGKHLYGGALQVCHLIKGLSDQNIQNILVCPWQSAIAGRMNGKAHVIELPIAGDLDIIFFFGLIRTIRMTRPDIIHVHSRRGADIWGGLAAWLTRVPAVITRRVDNPESRLAVRLKYSRYQRIITISRGIHQVLQKQGIDGDRMRCVKSAVDHRVYENRCDRKWLETTFDIPPGARVIGMIAQLIHRKGHRFLLSVIPRILAEHPDAFFLFLGQGPLFDELKGWYRHCRKMDEKICFAGFRNDLARILPCLYMVVHPATMEGLGVSLLQAAAAGIPVIASRAGGLPEVVIHDKTGLLIAPGDTDALARAVICLLDDPAYAGKLGKTGRMHVQTNFSIDQMVSGNLSVYREILV
ncbi:glycosyltransferase family 4 protein [Desulfobacter sp.]